MYSRGGNMSSGGESYGYSRAKKPRFADADSYLQPFSAGLGFPVVRLRGLPFNCHEGDISAFLAGLDILDILLVHKQGRFSGEAYVLLAAPMQVDFALQRNKQNIGHRYIEVFRGKKHDYYHAIAAETMESNAAEQRSGNNSAPPPPRSNRTNKAASDEADMKKEAAEHTGVLRLRGLPFSVSKKDIKEFFVEYDLSDEDIHVVTYSDGRASGEAYVEFAGPTESKEAMGKDKMLIGNRYVELFPSSREEASLASAKLGK